MLDFYKPVSLQIYPINHLFVMTILEMYLLLHKGEINNLGTIWFAQETGQKLTNIYSEDSANVKNNESKTSGTLH